MDKIELSKMLGQLRKELLDTRWEGRDSDLKFLIEDIEIELQIAATEEVVGGGGVKFWVFNAEAKIDASEVKTQKLKLKLKPVGPDGKEIPVSDAGRRDYT